jgi:hypothetical protein
MDNKYRQTCLMVVAAFLLLVLVTPSGASTYSGTLKLGGIGIDEKQGDRSAVQETYNLYDGFNVTQILLNGELNPRNMFSLNLREINLNSRKGDFLYRVPGKFRFTSHYDQHRQVFDADRAVTSDRKDWRFGADFTPVKWLKLIGDYNINKRDGNRLSYPAGTDGWLGNAYDYTLHTGGIEGQVVRGRRGGGVRYDVSQFNNPLDDITRRKGHLVSVRFNTPCYFWDKWTHFVRGAWGKHTVRQVRLSNVLLNFQYTGIIVPTSWFKFRYNLFLNSVDNESTALKTNNVQNNFDGDFFHRYGRLSAGYGYETNNDDRLETNYNTYRVGGTFNYNGRVSAKLFYANRAKNDEEKRTLLQDIESEQIRADLKLKIVDELVVGGRYIDRKRDYTDIEVTSEGERTNVYLSYTYPGWLSLFGDAAYGREQYVDRVGTFDTDSRVLTSRLTFDRVSNLMLAGAVTYLEIGKDLDIKKRIVSLEGEYTIADVYHVEVKYNVYNYDDYILTDRYYEANVVWFNVAYDFQKSSAN